MEELFIGVFALFLILFYLSSGIWVFIGLILVSVTLQLTVLGFSFERVGGILSRVLLRSSSSWELAAIPMFIWMGEIIYRTDISNRLFAGLIPLTRRLPGRLLHINVVGAALFASISGSSTATTVMVGKISLKQLFDRGYSRNVAIGSLAGAGSLGLLIPPSIVMIVYGILAEVSIVKLFTAGIVPGLMVAGLYSAYIIGLSVFRPDTVGESSLSERHTVFDGLKNLAPILVLMFIVLGSIYSGLATPSEAAAIGVVSALTVTAAIGQLSFSMLKASLEGAIRTSAMVVTLVVAAAFLSTTMGYLRLPQNVATFIASLELSPYTLMIAFAFFYLLLGLFLEGISITVMSLPIILPLVLNAGFDPIWFGIFLILMVELATITPPVGFNLFVIQGLTQDSIGRVARAAGPFFLLLCLGVVLLTAFPGIALWLPSLMENG